MGKVRIIFIIIINRMTTPPNNGMEQFIQTFINYALIKLTSYYVGLLFKQDPSFLLFLFLIILKGIV